MTVSSTSARIRQKLNLKKYLVELGVLVGRLVRSDELTSVVETAAIREDGKKFLTQAVTSSVIAFSDRNSKRFSDFVKRLHDANPSPIYVWTPRTFEGGALLVLSLSEINFDFDFNLNEEGILVFVTRDMADKLLLDFSALPSGEKILKVETQGRNWGVVAY